MGSERTFDDEETGFFDDQVRKKEALSRQPRPSTPPPPAWSVEEALQVLGSHAQEKGCMFERLAETLQRVTAERDEARVEVHRLKNPRAYIDNPDLSLAARACEERDLLSALTTAAVIGTDRAMHQAAEHAAGRPTATPGRTYDTVYRVTFEQVLAEYRKRDMARAPKQPAVVEPKRDAEATLRVRKKIEIAENTLVVHETHVAGGRLFVSIFRGYDRDTMRTTFVPDARP